jgi:hypothetical protein
MNVRSRSWPKRAGLVVLVLFAAAQTIRPARVNPPIDSSRTIEHLLPVAPETATILERACSDCHSSHTTWPWYSHVAPVSWFVIDHVNHGRTHLNLSDWARVAPQDADHLLGQICTLTSSGEMPIGSYLLMHGNAKLSDEDVRVLCEWTRLAQAHLKGGVGGVTGSRQPLQFTR